MRKIFKDHNLSRIWEHLQTKIKNGIQILPSKVNENEINIGQSKLGGCPDLPKDIDWFKFNEKSMSFIAQINLEEASKFDLDNKLPKEGILYFFYDSKQEAWGFDPKDKKGSKVYYYKGEYSKLERKAKPTDLEEYSHFESCKLTFSSIASIPEFENDSLDLELNDEESDRYYDLIEEEFDGEIHKLLGHADIIQNRMELECELVTNGLYCGNSDGYNNLRAKELGKNVDLWNLLLQVDSNGESKMMWGDSGRLYFWIKDQDLKDEKFENAWVILQCY